MICYKTQDEMKRFGDFSACMRVSEKCSEIDQKWLMSRPLGSMCRPKKVMSQHILKRVWKFSKINYMCRPIRVWVDTYWTNFEKFKKLFLCADLYEICVDTDVQNLNFFDTCEFGMTLEDSTWLMHE